MIAQLEARDETFIPIRGVVPGPVGRLEWSAEFIDVWRAEDLPGWMLGYTGAREAALPVEVGRVPVAAEVQRHGKRIVELAGVAESPSSSGPRERRDERPGDDAEDQQRCQQPRQHLAPIRCEQPDGSQKDERQGKHHCLGEIAEAQSQPQENERPPASGLGFDAKQQAEGQISESGQAQIGSFVETDQIQRGPDVQGIAQSKQRPGRDGEGPLPAAAKRRGIDCGDQVGPEGNGRSPNRRCREQG